MELTGRRAEHQRNPELEALLAELGRDLAPAALEVVERFEAPRLPLLFIVGCPRSGTTLAYQWLAESGNFTFPSNFVSRFPTAPWVGARIERLLTDPTCDHNDELSGFAAGGSNYRSHLGKTTGLSSAHEFWYFWRRFLPDRETHCLDQSDLGRIDTARLKSEFAAWEAVHSQPILMKAMVLNWNLPWLAEVFPHALFLHVRRDPLDTAHSLLKAREEFTGDRNNWYSFRPPSWPRLKNLDPVHQVAGQVVQTDLDVCSGLDQISAQRSLTIDYSDLCNNPASAWKHIAAMFATKGIELPAQPAGPDSFAISNHDPDPDLDTLLRSALHAEGLAETARP